jgi:steroid delta-isomerase-like uncharacterized protein
MTQAERNLATVLEHVRRENAHDLRAIMDTFGSTARYDDEPWNDHRTDHASVEKYYADLLKALPDLQITVERHTASDERVVIEVTISGTHRGRWNGLPATGRKVSFPLCAVFTFGPEGKLAGERIYYDRWAVLKQAGLLNVLTAFIRRPFG